MSDPYRPVDPQRIKTYPLAERAHRVKLEDFARPVEARGSLATFLDGLSHYLGARTLRALARTIAAARHAQRPVIWALGGHVVKVGLSPVLIDLMERGTLTGLVLNGAAAIHDWEIAAIGATSENVEQELDRGRFGLAEETGAEFDAAAREARDRSEGLGETLGRRILESGRPYGEASLLAAASRLGLPTTVHVAIGSDTVHQHPRADGAAIGAAALTDFRRLVTLVGELSGGVWINCGSAVQLPEVFLKALATARNLGRPAGPFNTANLDMQRHYRTEHNVLRRPVRAGGAAFDLLGHHEINVPLLAAAIQLEQSRVAGDG